MQGKQIKCLKESEMVGATIKDVDYSSDRLYMETDKGVISITDESTEGFMILHNALNISNDTFLEWKQ